MSVNPETASRAELQAALPQDYQQFVDGCWPGTPYLRLLIAEELALGRAPDQSPGQVTYADRILSAYLQPREYMEATAGLYDQIHSDMAPLGQRVGLRTVRQDRNATRPITHFVTQRTLYDLPSDERQEAALHIIRLTDGVRGRHTVRLVPDSAVTQLRADYLPELGETDWVAVNGIITPTSKGKRLIEANWGTMARTMEGETFWGSRPEGDNFRLLLQHAGHVALSAQGSQYEIRQIAGLI